MSDDYSSLGPQDYVCRMCNKACDSAASFSRHREDYHPLRLIYLSEDRIADVLNGVSRDLAFDAWCAEHGRS